MWFLNNLVFTVWGQPHAQPQTWRTRVSLSVWLLPLDLSGVGDPTSSYTTAGIALRVSGALKLHHHDKVETPSMGTYITNCLRTCKCLLNCVSSVSARVIKYFPNHLLNIRVDFLKLFVTVLLYIGSEQGVLLCGSLHQMP
jgi:hypothetical protein